MTKPKKPRGRPPGKVLGVFAKKKPGRKPKPKGKIKAPRPIGRPPFEVTPATRRKVERLVGMNIPPKAIAGHLGCDILTLKKYFAEELQYGKDRAQAEIADMLWDAAHSGNVSAQRKVYAIVHGVPEVVESNIPNKDTSEEGDGKKKKLGKKDQQLLDAESVTDKFEAPKPPPKLVVVNND